MWIALWPLCMLGAWQPMVTPRLCVQLTYIQRWNLCTIYTPLAALHTCCSQSCAPKCSHSGLLAKCCGGQGASLMETETVD